MDQRRNCSTYYSRFLLFLRLSGAILDLLQVLVYRFTVVSFHSLYTIPLPDETEKLLRMEFPCLVTFKDKKRIIINAVDHLRFSFYRCFKMMSVSPDAQPFTMETILICKTINVQKNAHFNMKSCGPRLVLKKR